MPRCRSSQSGAGRLPTHFHSSPAGGQLSPEPAAAVRSTAAAHSAACAALLAVWTHNSAKNSTSESFGSPGCGFHQSTSEALGFLAAFAEPARDAQKGGHQRQKTPGKSIAPGIFGLGPDAPVLTATLRLAGARRASALCSCASGTDEGRMQLVWLSRERRISDHSSSGGAGSTLVCIQSGNVKLRHLGAIKSHFQHMAQWSG